MNGERKGGDCRGELRGRRSGLPCRPAPWSDATAIIRLVSYGARAVEGGRGCGAICVRACLCRSVGRGARAGGATSGLDRRCAAAALLSAWGVGVGAPRLATPCEQLLWRQAVAARDMASPNVFLEILRDNRRLRSTTVKLRQVLEAARKGKGQIRIGRRAPVRAGQSRSRRRS